MKVITLLVFAAIASGQHPSQEPQRGVDQSEYQLRLQRLQMEIMLRQAHDAVSPEVRARAEAERKRQEYMAKFVAFYREFEKVWDAEGRYQNDRKAKAKAEKLFIQLINSEGWK